MYHHVKNLMYTVRVDQPDPRFGNMLLEQFGGANGELAAALQYSIQGINCEDMERKDLLMDIGTEELSHLEVIGTLARLHLSPMKAARDAAEADPLVAIAGGGGVALHNSMGNPWTADYLKITGELDVDLRSNIAAEARAKIVYERLLNFTDDRGTRDALMFLMTREIAHMKAFTIALETMQKPAFSIGQIPPMPEQADSYFNTSTGEGDFGEYDAQGPWNKDGVGAKENGKPREARGILVAGEAPLEPSAILEEQLAEVLHDIHDAELQVMRVFPEMAEAANTKLLQSGLMKHLEETRLQVQRLEQGLELLGVKVEHKLCKGMAGLIAECKDSLDRGAESEELAADLALASATQKLEHYEIASYSTAIALAQQLGQVEIANLLQSSLVEEKNANLMLNQLTMLTMEAIRADEAAAGEEDFPDDEVSSPT